MTPRVALCLGGVRLTLLSGEEFAATLLGAGRAGSGEPVHVTFLDLDRLARTRRGEPADEHQTTRPILLPAGKSVMRRLAALGASTTATADADSLAEALSAAASAGQVLGMVSRTPSDAARWLGKLWPGGRNAPAVTTWSWPDPSDERVDPAVRIRQAGVDILLVDLDRAAGRAWIERAAAVTGAAAYIERPAYSARLGLGAVVARHMLATRSHVVPDELVRDERRSDARPGVFVGPLQDADVCALVVTYRSAAAVQPLLASLRAQAGRHRIRVVVVDNASDDGTLELVRQHPDVIGIDAGANLGYSGALNIARAHARPCSSLLVLNPDLVLGDRALDALLDRLGAMGGRGAVIPRILDDCGAVQLSLRREPTWLRALGDALFGETWARRPAWLSELVLDGRQYDRARPIDWATGAVLLVDLHTEAAVGLWDERFFLYSEEVDYCRRVRSLGREVWFEPRAVVWHHGGGSSQNPALIALLAVNRVRYFEKWHGRLAGLAYRLPVALGELRRALAPAHRASAAYALGLRRWSSLPTAEDRMAGDSQPPGGGV